MGLSKCFRKMPLGLGGGCSSKLNLISCSTTVANHSFKQVFQWPFMKMWKEAQDSLAQLEEVSLPLLAASRRHCTWPSLPGTATGPPDTLGLVYRDAGPNQWVWLRPLSAPAGSFPRCENDCPRCHTCWAPGCGSLHGCVSWGAVPGPPTSESSQVVNLSQSRAWESSEEKQKRKIKLGLIFSLLFFPTILFPFSGEAHLLFPESLHLPQLPALLSPQLKPLTHLCSISPTPVLRF